MAKGAPETIGPYEILGELGRGGMGVVYKAVRHDIGREVALKVVRPDIDADPDAMARFAREARAAATLAGHPGIVGVLDAGEEDGRAYFAMEYVQARSLDACIDAGELDWRTCAKLIAKVACAVDHAHVNGILHRDIKPSNILIDDGGEPWVTDFGLARSTDAGPESAKLTQSGYVVGTPAYLSPEQARAGAVDGRADVWSLGVTLYECLTALMPFQGDSTFELLNQVQREDPKPVRTLAPEVPADLDTITLKCLEKVPDRRYPTAAALAADLEAFLEGRPIAARPPSLGYRASRWAGRNRKAVWTAAAATVLLGGGGALLYATVIGPRWRAEEEARVQADSDAAAAKQAEAKKAGELEIELAAARAREAALPHLDAGRETLLRLERVLSKPGWTADERVRLADEARAEFELALAACPDHPEALLETARAWRIINAPEQAIAACTRALAVHPKFTPARLERAILALEDLADLSGARFSDAERASARERVGMDLAVLRTQSTDASELAVANGMLAMAERRWPEAGELLQAIAEKRVSDSRAWVWAGWAWHEALREEQAEQAFTAALRFRPWKITALRGRGLARDELGKPKKAIEDFDLILRLRPHEWGTYVNRGMARRRVGEWEGAEADLTRAIDLNPGSAQAFTGRGLVRYKTGRLREARADLEQAVKLDPGLEPAHFHLGYVLASMGDLKGAQREFGLAIEIDPNLAEAYAYRGAMRQHNGDLDGALADANKAMELDPDSALGLLTRSRILAALGKQDAALADLDRSVEIEPTYCEARYDRARIRLARSNEAGALEDLEAALASAPPNWPQRSIVEQYIAALRQRLGKK